MNRIAVAVLLGLAGGVVACPPPVIVRQRVVVSEAVATATITPTVIFIPTYGAAFAPQQQSRDDELIKILKSIDDRLRRLEQGGGRPSKGVKAPPALASCTGCHTRGKLDEETKFEMFAADGTMLALTEAQLGLAARKVARKQMPPAKFKGPPVEDAARNEIADFFESLDAAPSQK